MNIRNMNKQFGGHLYIFVKYLVKYNCEILIFEKFRGIGPPRLYLLPSHAQIQMKKEKKK
jgi:hypothetical protein